MAVRYIYDMYIALQNLSDVARLCNGHGYRGKRGKPFTAFSIYKILNSPIYCGYKFSDGVPETCTHEPIIPISQFNKAQAALLDASGRAGRGRKTNTVGNILV